MSTIAIIEDEKDLVELLAFNLTREGFTVVSADNGRAGLELKMESIRGGTDGSRLSFMGLPCPNLFAGEQAIHSKLEFISVQDMNKAVETMVHLVSICTEKS